MFIMAVAVDVWAICVLPVKFVHWFCLNTENNVWVLGGWCTGKYFCKNLHTNLRLANGMAWAWLMFVLWFLQSKVMKCNSPLQLSNAREFFTKSTSKCFCIEVYPMPSSMLACEHFRIQIFDVNFQFPCKMITKWKVQLYIKLNVKIISEPPYFLRRPEDTVAVAGTDVTLECQVSTQQ